MYALLYESNHNQNCYLLYYLQKIMEPKYIPSSIHKDANYVFTLFIYSEGNYLITL